VRGIDFRAVKLSVPPAAVLALLHWTPARGGGPFGCGDCLLCGAGTRRWRPFHASPQGWFCHACGEGGNYLDLWRKVRRTGLYFAAVELCERAGVVVPYLPRRPQQARPASS
jgi:hypothetical protein